MPNPLPDILTVTLACITCGYERYVLPIPKYHGQKTYCPNCKAHVQFIQSSPQQVATQQNLKENK